jgi:secondary thiamine-phosphate synthase enzyme
MDSIELRIDNGADFSTDLTAYVSDFCRGLGDGLLSVFVPHATAGVALMEVGSGSEADLSGALDRLLPTDDRYRHRHGHVGHGRDHVLPAFVSASVTVPVFDGVPALGTWQSIVLVDTNSDNPSRRVRLSFVPA